MKPLSKYFFTLITSLSLVACGSNNTSIIVEPLPEGLGVGVDAFDAEANANKKKYDTYSATYKYQYHETLEGTWPLAKDINTNLLPDGSDLYGTATIETETKNGGMKIVSQERDKLPSWTMVGHASAFFPIDIEGWKNYNEGCKTNKTTVDFEEKYFINPLRMYFKYSEKESFMVEGSYLYTIEWDVTFRKDGYIDTTICKETTVVDGVVTATADTHHLDNGGILLLVLETRIFIQCGHDVLSMLA